MKKSLNIGVFNPSLIMQASPYCGDNVFAKGLEQNGYEVIRFDYRAVVSPNEELISLAQTLKASPPSIVWMGKCERIASETVKQLRILFPDAIFVKWAADVRDTPTEHDLAHCSQVDWFFGTFGGDYLKSHLLPNMIGVGSIFTFTDSDYYSAEEVEPTYLSDVLWTGRRGFGDNPLRNEIIDTLDKIVVKQAMVAKLDSHVDIKMFGHIADTWIGEPDYQQYVNGARIGIGSNSFNRHKYSSDRLGNYMSCGTFYLTQHIEGIEEVFVKGEHLDWFTTTDEMLEKINYYLAHPVERSAVAERGRQRVLEHFDCRPLVRTLLQIIKHNKKQHAWEDVFIN